MAKKLNLDFVKENDIDHDKTFLYDVMVSKCTRLLNKSGKAEREEYIVSFLGNASPDPLVVDDEKSGPAVQALLQGDCFVFMCRGTVVGIGKGRRYLRVRENKVITHSIRERYKRISKTESFEKAYNGKSVGETTKIDEPTDEQAVVIHNHLDPVTVLYDKNDNMIGQILNTVALVDVCAQIKKKKLSGYYIMFNGKKLKIRKDGNIRHPPKGFYDAYETCVKFVMGF